MPITIGNSGNRTIRTVTVGDGGANRTVKAVYVGDGGANRLVFAALNLVGLDPQAFAVIPANASATYTLTNAGSEQATGAASSTWLLAGSASDYDVFATLNSGSLTSGTTGTWLNLGISRSWNVTRSVDVIGVSSANLTIQIRLAATGTVLDSASVTITAQTDV